MIEIFVTRGDGDMSGDAIVDALITSVPVALARGAAEINGSCPAARKILTVDMVPVPFLLSGTLGRVDVAGTRRAGKIRSFEKQYTVAESDFEVSCTMTVEVLDV